MVPRTFDETEPWPKNSRQGWRRSAGRRRHAGSVFGFGHWLLPWPPPGDLELERKAEEGADAHDHGQHSDACVRRFDGDCTDDIAGYEELQPQQDRSPDATAIAAVHARLSATDPDSRENGRQERSHDYDGYAAWASTPRPTSSTMCWNSTASPSRADPNPPVCGPQPLLPPTKSRTEASSIYRLRVPQCIRSSTSSVDSNAWAKKR